MKQGKSLEKLQSDPRVKSVDVLGEAKSGATLSLKKGFIDGESAMHIMTGSVSEFVRRMKYVEPCSCWQCAK